MKDESITFRTLGENKKAFQLYIQKQNEKNMADGNVKIGNKLKKLKKVKMVTMASLLNEFIESKINEAKA